jgi:hypothetical protein
MNVKTLALASALALGSALSVQSANAASWTFTPGGTSTAFDTLPVSGATVDTFESAAVGSLSDPYVTLLATYTGPATIANSTTSSGAKPAGDDSVNYLVISPQAPPNPLTITFNQALNTFGFYWGSIDTYNVPVTLNFSDSTSLSFDPSTLLPHDGDQGAPATNGYITFSSPGLTVASLMLGSTGVAFELDNVFGVVTSLASTTPLPATLPLFATGLGALGLMGWRRRRKAAVLAF